MSSRSTQQAQRPSTAQPSATVTITTTPSDSPRGSGRLRLRGEADPQQDQRSQRRIRWAEDVVNNEGMGKKSSKVCCIYHKPREVGESSSEESSSSSSDSDSDSNDDGAARPIRRHGSDDHAHQHGQCGKKPAKKSLKSSPNAYEKQPKSVTEKTQPKT